MDTSRELICYKEIEQIQSIPWLSDGDSSPVCITMHPEFSNTCLSRTVLTIAFHGYVHCYGSSDIPSDENR